MNQLGYVLQGNPAIIGLSSNLKGKLKNKLFVIQEKLTYMLMNDDSDRGVYLESQRVIRRALYAIDELQVTQDMMRRKNDLIVIEQERLLWSQFLQSNPKPSLEQAHSELKNIWDTSKARTKYYINRGQRLIDVVDKCENLIQRSQVLICRRVELYKGFVCKIFIASFH